MTGTAVATDVLHVEDLSVHYQTPRRVVKAVNRVSFTLRPGERLGLAGESGSGKSTTALAIMRLIRPPGKIATGSILLGGRDLAKLSEEGMRQVRLAEVALIPQGAMNSLNPVRRIRDHFADSIAAHDRTANDTRIRERTKELLRMVELREDVAKLYPHELSGGMKQRVCIALGISLQPKVIIADEPTSALDVVVQRQVMQTLGTVQQQLGASVILVGHDMGLLAQFVDRLAVMYAGRFVEVAPIREIFRNAQHPYTRGLIESLPTLGEKGIFRGMSGRASAFPDPDAIPDLEELAPDHWVAPHPA
ncbi:MAG TPA: ABC transporter ATP-binding protein [Thermomicrobiales bacterium]|jgi:peptide/nickel transport system ATP-binding protein